MLHMISEIFNTEIEIICNDEKMEEHYEITASSFKPRVAKKNMSKINFMILDREF